MKSPEFRLILKMPVSRFPDGSIVRLMERWIGNGIGRATPSISITLIDSLPRNTFNHASQQLFARLEPLTNDTSVDNSELAQPEAGGRRCTARPAVLRWPDPTVNLRHGHLLQSSNRFHR